MVLLKIENDCWRFIKILFNYGREVNYRELGDFFILLVLLEVMNGLIV